MSKLLNINKVRSFFQRKKQILVDGCCDTETACCDVTIGVPCVFNIYGTLNTNPRVEITSIQAPFIGNISINSVDLGEILFEIFSSGSTLNISNINVNNINSGPTISTLPINPYSLNAGNYGVIAGIEYVPPGVWTPGQTYNYAITFTITCNAIVQNATINLAVKG